MNSEILTPQNENLKKDISGTISYWFGLSMLDNANSARKMQKQLGNKESAHYKLLYNALSSDINKAYSMNGIGKAIDGYSEKYEEYFDSFAQKLDDFSRITANNIISVIKTGFQGSFNVKKITEAAQKMIDERNGKFKEYLQKNIGQLENYVLLLTGADTGNSKYLYVSETSGTCNACSGLDGKIFAVNEAESRVNFPPIHPNCKCRIELSRTYGGEHGSVLLNQVNSNDLLGKLPYIDKDVSRIEAGNDGGAVLETYGPFLWDNKPEVSPWLNENTAKENSSKEVLVIEDEDEIIKNILAEKEIPVIEDEKKIVINDTVEMFKNIHENNAYYGDIINILDNLDESYNEEIVQAIDDINSVTNTINTEPQHFVENSKYIINLYTVARLLQIKSNVPAAIVVGQAIIETGFQKDNIRIDYITHKSSNNLFNIEAYPDIRPNEAYITTNNGRTWRSFDNIIDSVYALVHLLDVQYRDYLKEDTIEGWAQALVDGGFCDGEYNVAVLSEIEWWELK